MACASDPRLGLKSAQGLGCEGWAANAGFLGVDSLASVV